MEDDEVAFGDRPLELDVLAGVLGLNAFEVGDECFLPVGDLRVVLAVGRAGELLEGRPGLALVEHQAVEGHRVGLHLLGSWHLGRLLS